MGSPDAWHRVRSVLGASALLSFCCGPEVRSSVHVMRIADGSTSTTIARPRGELWEALAMVEGDGEPGEEILAFAGAGVVLVDEGGWRTTLSGAQGTDAEWVARGDGSRADLFVLTSPLGDLESTLLRHSTCDVHARPPCEPAAEQTIGAGVSAFVADDFDEDGRIDLVTASDVLALHRGVGTDPSPLRWEPGEDIGGADGWAFGWGQDIVAADLDGDAHRDIVAADGVAGVRFFFGDGSGRFEEVPAVSRDSPFVHVHVAPIVGDALPDVVARGDYGSVALENRGARSFQPAQELGAVLGDGNDFVVGDFDGDGSEDLLVLDQFGTRTRLATRSAEAGTWALIDLGIPSLETIYADGVVVGDVDGDGRDELVSIFGPPIYCE